MGENTTLRTRGGVIALDLSATSSSPLIKTDFGTCMPHADTRAFVSVYMVINANIPEDLTLMMKVS